ncbi:MAG: TetR/AcrR family transcriptional regulator [Pseudomonadota bacterium]
MATYHHGNLRQEVLNCAIAMITDHGVEGLSLRKVAKELGVSHAAPGHHFKSKADLLAEIIQESYEQMTGAILVELDRHPSATATQRLRVMASTCIRWAVENKARFSVMMNPDVSRFTEKAVHDALADFVRTVADAIGEAKEEGFYPKTSNAVLLLYAIGAANGIATALTYDVMKTALGVELEEHAYEELANLIVDTRNDHRR